MANAPIKLARTVEEAAYHEAGHLAIELLQDLMPQLCVLRETDGQWSGECYSCSPTSPEDNCWRAEKAVAGVLAQARYMAELTIAGDVKLSDGAAIQKLTEFLMTAPDDSRSCPVEFASASDGAACIVDLGTGYFDCLIRLALPQVVWA